MTGNVTKVTWTTGQRGSMLSLGGKAVLGEGCLASCEPFAGRLLFERGGRRCGVCGSSLNRCSAEFNRITVNDILISWACSRDRACSSLTNIQNLSEK